MVNQVGKYNVPYQALTPAQVNTPNAQLNMEGVDKDKIKQDVQNVSSKVKDRAENNYTSSRLTELLGEDYEKKALLSIPIWYGIAQGMDKFAEKCRGNYDNTVLYRIGDFGDRMASKFDSSAVGKSSVTKGVKGFFKGIGKFYNEKMLPNSAILRSLKHTPSVPEHSMVLGQAGGMKGFLLFDYPQYADNFLKPLKSAADLDCYGAGVSKIAEVQKELAKAVSKEAKAKILERAEFELLNDGRFSVSEFLGKSGVERGSILKDIKAKAMGYLDAADFEAVKKDIHSPKGMERVMEACQKASKAGDKYISRIWGSRASKWGMAKTHIIGRDVKFSEMLNKLIGSLGTEKIGKFASPHKTWLGKMLPKMSNIFLEGSTNRVAGGKFIAIMQAFWLAEVLMKTAKAEKGDKVKTFTERFTELLGFFIFMPMAIQLLHRAGGLQYAGMSKEQVSAYRKAVEAFNAKADAAKFASKAAYKAERKSLRNMLNAGTKNPITKLLKRAGRVLTVGLEQLRPFSKTTAEKGAGFLTMARAKDIFRHPKYWFKQAAGWPLRFGLVLITILPILNKIGVKTSHAIFGRPKHSTLDKEEEVKPQQQLSQADALKFQQLLEEAKRKQALQTGNLLNPYKVNQPVNIPNVSNNSPSNLIHGSQPVVTNRVVNNTINNNIVNDKKDDDKVPEPVRTYVPSPVGVQLSAPDMSEADAALKKAAAAEEEALRVLKMK